MTPKEQAVGLINKFESHVKWGYDNEGNWINHAKQCALIAVEQIINELEQLRKPEYTTFVLSYETQETNDGYEKIDYWQSVKKEIEST